MKALHNLNILGAKIIASVLLFISAQVCNASGYGWHVYSFDWDVYVKAKPLIEKQFLRVAQKALPPDYPADSRKDMALNIAFYGCCELFGLDIQKRYRRKIDAVITRKNESPEHLEYYWPDSLRYAAELSSKADGAEINYFLLFRNGRPYWSDTPSEKCESGWFNHSSKKWGYCIGAYFVLSPDEISRFHRQVAQINSTTNHPKEYRDYLVELENVLATVKDKKKGLYFTGHD